MFSNCITPTASLFAYVMYSNIMPNVIISFRHGRFFSFAWYNPLLLQMCLDGFLSFCSTEMLYRTGILVFFIILVLVEVCILSHHHIYILMHLNNVISFLDRSNALIVLLNCFSNTSNFSSIYVGLDPVYYNSYKFPFVKTCVFVVVQSSG